MASIQMSVLHAGDEFVRYSKCIRSVGFGVLLRGTIPICGVVVRFTDSEGNKRVFIVAHQLDHRHQRTDQGREGERVGACTKCTTNPLPIEVERGFQNCAGGMNDRGEKNDRSPTPPTTMNLDGDGQG